MAKVLSMSTQNPDKSMEDIFKNLSNSSARIALMMTALQKYQNMTVPEARPESKPHLLVDPVDVSTDEESVSTPTEAGPPSSSSTPTQPPPLVSAASTPALKKQTLIGKLSVKIVSAKNLVKGELLSDAFCVLRVRFFFFLLLLFPFLHSPERDREYQLNEKYMLAVHTSKHIEDRIREQDDLHGTDYASHFVAKKRTDSPTKDPDSNGSAPSSAASGTESSKKARQAPTPPSQSQLQKKFKVDVASLDARSAQSIHSYSHAPSVSPSHISFPTLPTSATQHSSSTGQETNHLLHPSAYRSETAEYSRQPSSGMSREDFENLGVTEAMAMLEQNQGAAEVDPYRNWVTTVSSKIPADNTNPHSLKTDRELDAVAQVLLVNMGQTEDTALGGESQLLIQKYLSRRAVEESRLYGELSHRFKSQLPLFKDATLFERVFQDYYLEAKDIVERAALARKKLGDSSRDLHDDSSNGQSDEIIDV